MKKSKNAKRSNKMTILFSVIGFVVICIAIVVLTSLYISNPTKGAVITQRADSKSALLVVDVQNDITGNTGAYRNTDEFVKSVNQAIFFAEENGMEILYVKNEYGNNPITLLLSGGRFRKDTEGAAFDRDLYVVNENVFSKSIGDSFSSKAFDEYLVSHDVDTIYIVGADAAACIYSTARGGLNRNYNVCIIRDAVITRSDDIFNQMLNQYEKNSIMVIDMHDFKELCDSYFSK